MLQTKKLHHFLQLIPPSNVLVEISGIGLESARLSSERLVQKGVKVIVNPGICAGLHNRVKRGSVYRVASVVTEELKAAVNVGLGVGLKKLISVEKPLHDIEKEKNLQKTMIYSIWKGMQLQEYVKKIISLVCC